MNNHGLEQISKECRKMGLTNENVSIFHRWNDGVPYAVAETGVCPGKIITLNKKIAEIMSMYKLDQAVKSKYGEKASDKAWVQFGKENGFQNWYIKVKVKRYINTLNKYVSVLGLEVDFKERRKTPEELREEMIKLGYIKP